MDDSIQILRLLTPTLRPLYTKIVVMKAAINAIKLKRPSDAVAIDQMLEFARRSEDTNKQVDIELADLARNFASAQEEFGKAPSLSEHELAHQLQNSQTELAQTISTLSSIQLLEPQDAPRDVAHEAAKLRQELARIHGRLSSLLQKIQHPSVPPLRTYAVIFFN